MESIELVPETPSIRSARNFVSDYLASRGLGSWEAVLLVSELASNVVRHAKTPFQVTVGRQGPDLLIEVTDGAGASRLARRLASEQGGMGLGIVEELSKTWGVREDRDGGKTVWVTVPGSSLEQLVA